MTNLQLKEDIAENQEDPEFAVVKWRIADIKELRPNWTDEKCIAFLEEIESNLQDRMIERGWDVIDTLISSQP